MSDEISVDLAAYVTRMRAEAEACALRGELTAAGLLVGAGKLIGDLAGRLQQPAPDRMPDGPPDPPP